VKGADEITIVMDDNRELKAQLIGQDERTDLALLKVEADGQPFKYVKLAQDEAKVGQWVIAVGKPVRTWAAR
jgi:serine protease Do